MSTALAKRQNGAVPTTDETADVMQVGALLARSGFFQDAKQEAQAVAKVLAGHELGIPPVAAMTGVNIIKGRVTLSANLIASLVKRSGRYDYRVDHSDDGCKITFYEAGEPIGVSEFTREDAQQAGLLSGENWRKYPRNMFFARAISNGAKWYCPDIFGGPIYTPDELGGEVDGETGDVILAPHVETEAPQIEAPADDVTTDDNVGDHLLESVKDEIRAQLKEQRLPWKAVKQHLVAAGVTEIWDPSGPTVAEKAARAIDDLTPEAASSLYDLLSENGS